MEPFTKELVSNASAQPFPDNTLSSFNGGTESGRSMGGCIFGSILPINVPKGHTRKTDVFLIKKLLKSSEFHNLEPGIYRPITDIVEAMITPIEESHKHSQSCFAVKVSQRTQKVEIYLANQEACLAFFSKDPEHFFGTNVGKEFGAMLRGKGPRKPEFAYDIVRIHSLMI